MIHPWQQKQWLHISQLISAEHLPHAMLLLGNDGLGKTDFALSLANSVLCQQPEPDQKACGKCKSCHLLHAGTHPDIYHLKPSVPVNSKSANPVLSIKIDDVRQICAQLNQTSQYGKYRVALIEKAEYLTVSAANSLLKTLEEPGQNVLILIVTSRPHRLPATIRSRCQTLRFSPPEESFSLDWLQQKNGSEFSDEQLQLALNHAYGSPLAAQQQLNELEHQQLLSAAMTAKLAGKNSLDYAAKLAKFAKVKTLEGMLCWVSDLSRILACGPDAVIVNEPERSKIQVMANALAKKANQQRLFQFQDQLNFNLSNSTIALNEQLLWESLLLSWDNL